MRKKLFMILSAVLMILLTIQFTALAGEVDSDTADTSAAETEESVGETETDTTDTVDTPEPYGVSVTLYLMESNNDWSWLGGKCDKPEDWSEPASEPVYITEDGTYTLSLTDLEIPADTLMLCYIKDTEAYNQGNSYKRSNVPEDLMVITDVFKVNGSEKQVDSSLVRTGLQKGIFDVAYRNNWNEGDNCVNFTGVINSIEITFTVTGITGEPGAIKYEPTPPPATPTPTTAPTPAEEQEPATDTEDKVVDTSNETTADSADTGSNSPLIIGAVIAVIVIGAIVIIAIKKKK